MPKDKEFVDSRGLRGASFIPTTKVAVSTSRKNYRVRFEVCDDNHVRLYLPGNKTVLITKRNAIKLSHWLLARCTE